MTNDINQLRTSVYSSLVKKSSEANEKFKPKLVLNKYNETRVGATINKELSNCEEFSFSVAFINEAGIQYLLETLNQLNDKGIKGKILTSTYLNFNAPKAFRRLLQIPNVEVRITNKTNFHAKGYIFKSKNIYSMIIGSSNFTDSAFSRNTEWNLKLVSSYNGELIEQTLNEFKNEWDDSSQLTTEWIEEYSLHYVKNKMINRTFKTSKKVLMPNSMQEEALASLSNYRATQEKALVISATGTGKTYLAAFDARNFRDQVGRKIKILFIAHRERLLNGARDSYSNVFNDRSIAMDIFNADNKNFDVDYMFASVHTLSKDEYLHKLKKDHFDYIVYDEAHHCGANSYKKILDYFNPIFTLGMTATPERTDGINIYDLFDNNIAYEIRLQRALQEDMLCPFHYYGIEDLEVKGDELELNKFNNIITKERIDHIISKANYYGYSGERVKGLIFVSRNDFAQELERTLNDRGLKTKAISGIDNENERERCIESLESEDNDSLDYIISVDILSEGVDIPCINQIIMLRPTQSVIVFVQQLGRGLRKFGNKDYLVVLDFIGNYTNNYLIPVALSGDKTYNKDNLRKFIREKDVMLAAGSTVSFTKVIEDRIYESIDSASSLYSIGLIKEEYLKLKYKLGRIPTIIEFDTYGYIDPLNIFKNKTLGSYHNLLEKYDDDYDVKMNEIQKQMLCFISQKLCEGKRNNELLILKQININGNKEIDESLFFGNVYKVLTNDFVINVNSIKTFKNSIFVKEVKGKYFPTELFLKELDSKEFKKELLDTIEFGLNRFVINFSNKYDGTDFVLNQKYNYEDVCRLLNWEKNIVALNIGGYKYDDVTNTFPVFINYEKENDIADTIKYEDRFISQSDLIAISKTGAKTTSAPIKRIYDYKNNGLKIYLFVRKNKDDNISKEFYFLGEMEPYGLPIGIDMGNTGKTAVEINYKLKETIKEDLYEYIVN